VVTGLTAGAGQADISQVTWIILYATDRKASVHSHKCVLPPISFMAYQEVMLGLFLRMLVVSKCLAVYDSAYVLRSRSLYVYQLVLLRHGRI